MSNSSTSSSSKSSLINEELIINNITTTSSTLTNSIVITELPEVIFDSSEQLAQLNDLITSACTPGNILNFIVLKSFRRIVIIFDNFQSPYLVKNKLNNTVLNGLDINLNIYLLDYIQPTGNDNEQSYLQVDQFEQLFWLSPPPSPPADWQPQVEDGPNTKTLANDLMQALSKLQLEESGDSFDSDTSSPATQFKFEGIGLPTIIVEDVDPNTVNFIDRARLPKTSMPPTPGLLTSLSS
ncbi:Calcipressin-domain-containing protein [Conidiobolus coronatus NRRL 28638]|uniref:Calcipressin-domain-containing protein n=1 Tax=Conidiobolus coronatus (strain ATCC 28846 / CBS 209.66 / NRRL 28638) TaxID=796925 RepID=A0A137NY93_CONC2|nr:Calcipressin-domain-containing protein [Conidiobolus coronatus NRRL 28638]|eukprot:KXN67648.1 Calcipressin-domain-containing protein [Conidiobolus coronatus NRRL 28638]